jgi:Leucine-rich repeat (LRR) protein
MRDTTIFLLGLVLFAVALAAFSSLQLLNPITRTPQPTPAPTPAATVRVNFPDAVLDEVIREELRLGAAKLNDADMLALTSLYGEMTQSIQNLTGLEFATNLTTVYFDFEQISDVSALASLTNLEELWLRGNQISDVSALASLTNLLRLDLGFNQISDISPLASLPNLESLWLRGNPRLNLQQGSQTMADIQVLRNRGVRVYILLGE